MPTLTPEEPARRDAMRRVVHVAQSPLNATRWSLSLRCQHDIWVTAKSRPRKGRKVACPKCATPTHVTEDPTP